MGKADSELLNEVKILPIRIINSGAARALKHVTDKGLSTPTWIEGFAFDLNAAREVFTAHVRKEVRPNVEALAKIVTSLPQKPLKPSSCNSFCWRLGSERMYLLLFGYMMGYGLDVLLTTRFCMLQKDMSDNFFPHSHLTSSLSRSLACMRQAVVSTCPPPHTVRYLRNARKAPDGVGEDGRLSDSFLLPNSAIDKLLSASSRATLTGLTSAPAFAGVNTLHPKFGRFLVSGSPVCCEL